jgi:hypothetical protein
MGFALKSERMRKLLPIMFFIVLLSPLTSWAQTASKKTIIKYKEHTQLDFSGQKIEGRIRSPEVFYIFQRKRNLGPQIIELPDSLETERKTNKTIVEHNL